MKNKKRLMKIWWKIPNVEELASAEARDLIYLSMQIASDAYYHYNNVLREPIFFRSFELLTDADKGISIYNYMIGKIHDDRVKYFAELR
jgi:hypothetical protein